MVLMSTDRYIIMASEQVKAAEVIIAVPLGEVL